MTSCYKLLLSCLMFGSIIYYPFNIPDLQYTIVKPVCVPEHEPVPGGPAVVGEPGSGAVAGVVAVQQGGSVSPHGGLLEGAHLLPQAPHDLHCLLADHQGSPYT